MDGICARDELAPLADARTPSLPKAPGVVDVPAPGLITYNGIPQEHCDALLGWVKAQREEFPRFRANQLGITLEG